jgi:nitrate reductase beta subunit
LSTIKTYPLRVIEQLRLCERIIIKTNHHHKQAQGGSSSNSSSIVTTATHPDGKVVYGFECIHCASCSNTTTKDWFRKFPKSPKEVGYELVNFRNHLTNECQGIPTELQDYIVWMQDHCKKSKGTRYPKWYTSTDQLHNIGELVMTTLDPKWERHAACDEELTSSHRVRVATSTTTTTTTTTTATTSGKRMNEREKKAHVLIAKRRRHHHHSILEDLA